MRNVTKEHFSTNWESVESTVLRLNSSNKYLIWHIILMALLKLYKYITEHNENTKKSYLKYTKNKKVEVQVYSLISSLKTYQLTLHFTSSLLALFIRVHTLDISAHWIYCTHCLLFPTTHSFTPESNEACEGKARCPRTETSKQYPNVDREKHDIFLWHCKAPQLRQLQSTSPL